MIMKLDVEGRVRNSFRSYLISTIMFGEFLDYNQCLCAVRESYINELSNSDANLSKTQIDFLVETGITFK